MMATTTYKNPFRQHSKLFRDYALDALSKSNEYQGFKNQFDTVLLLADRVLAAFEEHLEFNQVQKIPYNLQRVNEAIGSSSDDESRAIEALIQSVEQWQKPLLWLVDRTSWDNLNKNKKRFTLFPCIRALNLLSQAELDTKPEDNANISDEVRRLLYRVVKDRNFVTHETYEAARYTRERHLSSALLVLIAPIYKHQDTIREKLQWLIPSSTIYGVCGINFFQTTP